MTRNLQKYLLTCRKHVSKNRTMIYLVVFEKIANFLSLFEMRQNDLVLIFSDFEKLSMIKKLTILDLFVEILFQTTGKRTKNFCFCVEQVELYKPSLKIVYLIITTYIHYNKLMPTKIFLK